MSSPSSARVIQEYAAYVKQDMTLDKPVIPSTFKSYMSVQ